jgi:hypothetical protein
MSDEDDWDFAGADDAKMTIRAAVRYCSRVPPVAPAVKWLKGRRATDSVYGQI